MKLRVNLFTGEKTLLQSRGERRRLEIKAEYILEERERSEDSRDQSRVDISVENSSEYFSIVKHRRDQRRVEIRVEIREERRSELSRQ